MPILHPLNPPITIQLTDGDDPISLEAREAGRSDVGLKASIIIANGHCIHSSVLPFLDAEARAQFATAAAGRVSVAPDQIERGITRLWEEVEVAVRDRDAHYTEVRTVPEGDDFDMSDLGNARRFVKACAGTVKFCPTMERWLIYDGARWVVDERLVHQERAKTVAGAIIREAAEEAQMDQRMKLLQHAKISQSMRAIRGMLSLASSDDAIAVHVDELDNNPGRINCHNGMLDLTTGVLHPHCPDDLSTKVVSAAYNSDATCPLWETFMLDIMNHKPALVDFLQRAVGSALLGQPTDRILVMLYGHGRNGKSTFLETIQAILGEYALPTPMETLIERRSGAIPNDIARLKGARFVAASEGPEGARLDAALVKRLTGNDTITARFLHKEYFSFRPNFILFVATNHKPVIRDTTDSIWHRVKLVPFEVQFRDRDQGGDNEQTAMLPDMGLAPIVDPKMPEKLLAEREGIFAWMVAGCRAWLTEGLTEPEEIRAATAEYRVGQDILQQWIDECCVTRPSAYAPYRDLYACYVVWCDDNGERAITGRDFGQRLGERGYASRNGTGGNKIRVGIGLLESAPRRLRVSEERGA